MQLSKALRLSTSSVVAFVGAGGKTSAMFRTAQELSPALVTTSTHLGAWQASMANLHFACEPDEPMPDLTVSLKNGITLVTGKLDEATGRFRGLTPPQLGELRQLAGEHALPLLIEADGARQKPLKAPAEHEPAIPEFVETVVVVAGLGGLNKALTEEHVQRAEQFAALSGLKIGDPVTARDLVSVLTHPAGGLKNIPSRARRTVLLNQAETHFLQAQANEIGQALLTVYAAAVVAAVDAPLGFLHEPVLAVKENIAGVILAAGKASRYGQPKQLLAYHGQPFVRIVAETALKAGLSPVVIVTGAHADLVHAAVADLPVTISHNPAWESGQGSSIHAGLTAGGSPAPGEAGGAIFLLADQPQVSVEVLRALMERHSQDFPAVLAPYVFDQRANPVLFDRVTFPDLLNLQGEAGGRAIFSKFSPRYLNWYDKRLLLDVDTPEDYEKLLRSEP
jgi:molybdenum cofactor cytidylyltransferase